MRPQEPTETSPLLAEPSATPQHTAPIASGVPSSSIGPGGDGNEISKHVPDEESQSIGEDRGHQYEGMPAMKAKLWSILPAVGLGVRPYSFLPWSAPDNL